jgi:hypothetical protein
VKSGDYIIVELDGAAVPGMLVKFTDGAWQTYPSLAKAEEWMRKDAKEAVNEAEMEIGRMQDWGTPVAICKVVRVCRPVPVVSVKIEIQDVNNVDE